MTLDEIITLLFRVTALAGIFGAIITVVHNRKIYQADMKAKDATLLEIQKVMNEKLLISLSEMNKLLVVLTSQKSKGAEEKAVVKSGKEKR